MSWFEVQATLLVKADDSDAAIDETAKVLRGGFEAAKGVYPVGTFQSRPTENRITRGLDKAGM